MTDDAIKVWVDPQKNRMYVRTPFQLKDAVKAIAGARWDGEVRCWHMPVSPASALELSQNLGGFDLDTDPRVEELLTQAGEEAGAMAHKVAAELPEIPGKMPAWLHQKRAYHFALARRGTMLAMDMGTGKSRTAISLLDGWKADLALIVCPSKVVGVWPKQFELHSDRRWHVIAPPTNVPVQKRAGWIKRQMLLNINSLPVAIVVNFEAAWREPMKSLLMLLMPGGKLIVDESHRIKAPGGTAAKFIGTRLAPNADRVLLLTGTPMPHSPLDLFAQFRTLDPGIFGTTFGAFRARYAVMGGFEGHQVMGYQNERLLAEKFGSASFVVKKEEAGLDLPPVVHVERKFVLSPASRRAYYTLEQDFILGVGDGTVTPANALVKLLRLQQITSGFVRDDDGVDHLVASDKLDLLADVLEDLPEREPVVIFARFKHDMAEIKTLLTKLGRTSAEVSGDVNRVGHPDYGLNADATMRTDVDVVVLQLQSGGVGIDLTRAAYCVYYSLDFSLGNYEQSLARLDRPGQTRSVTYIHLVAQDSKDEVVYKALQDRKSVVEAVISSSREIDEGFSEAA